MHKLMEGVDKGRLPNHLGDDTGDEDAFRAVRRAGISIAAGRGPEADYYPSNQGEVRGFAELPARTPRPGGTRRRAPDGGKGPRH